MVNEINFYKDVPTEGIAFVLCGTSSCGACKMQRGILNTFEKNTNALCYHFYGDKNIYEVDKFDMSGKQLPIMYIYKNGRVIFTSTGIVNRLAILEREYENAQKE